MSESAAKTLSVVGAMADIPALEIGAVQVLKSQYHILEYNVVKTVFSDLLTPGDQLGWDCFGNLAAAQHRLGDLSHRSDPLKTRGVLMLFETTRLSPLKMGELMQAGGPVGVFSITSKMDYDSSRAVGDDTQRKDVRREEARLQGRIYVPAGWWDFRVKAPNLDFKSWDADLAWVPLEKTADGQEKITGLKHLPVNYTATSSRGYLGD